MTNISKVGAPGGKPLAPAVSVYTDGLSISGNGTKEDPLVAAGGSIMRTIAGAVVNVTGSGAFVVSAGFSSLVKSTTGVWLLTLTTPPANINNVVAQATIVGGVAGQISWQTNGTNQIEVRTFDSTGAPADLRNFSVTVSDATPA